MGCFSTCFSKSRSPKSIRPRKTAPCLDQLLQRDHDHEALQLRESEKPEGIVKAIDTLPDKEDEQREKLNNSWRKKVTFDLNVKIYERLPAEEEPEGDFLVKSSDAEEEEEKEEEKGEKEDKKANKAKESQCHSDSSSSSSLFSFPHNSYRYQNCRDSDDEFDQVVSDDDSDLDHYMGDEDDDEDEDDEEDEEGEEEVNNDHLVVQEESSESLFSLSINSRRHKLSTETGDKEVNSPVPVKTAGSYDEDADAIKNSNSVLQPVENRTQWKAIKARSKRASQNKAKENKISARESSIPISDEPILKQPVNPQKNNSAKSNKSYQEIAVDTSLSTWLMGCDAATPTKSKTSSPSVGKSTCSDRTNSPKDFEDRPILGAMTVEEMKQLSSASTPRKSPSRSPDEMPIIGTVGSYWSHTGQSTSNSRSKIREHNAGQQSELHQFIYTI